MPHNFAARPTDSDKQQSTPHGDGPPVQRSFRGVIRERYEDEGARIVEALAADLESTGLADAEIAERTGVDKAQLSRIRAGQAHPPGRLIAWAIDQSRHSPAHLLIAVCAAGEGEFKPKPPPSVEDRYAATFEVLVEMGIEEVVMARVLKKLGVAK